jgi:hypothetical protein
MEGRVLADFEGAEMVLDFHSKGFDSYEFMLA